MPVRPRPLGGAPASDRGWSALNDAFVAAGRACLVVLGSPGRSALALLVARVGTDDHDPAMPADHPALVADPLDARLDLHGFPFSGRVDVTCTGRRCGHGSGRTGKAPRRPGPPAGYGCSAAASCR